MSINAAAPVFKPRARLLLLLGDELIRDAGIAVFELVKNAYDADSSTVEITMRSVGHPGKGQITVRDDGEGMDVQTIENVWLEPGTDFRRTNENVAPKRQSLGEARSARRA